MVRAGVKITEEDEWSVSTAGAQEVSVAFESSLRVPTLMHVISNAENDMMETCEKYNAATASLGDIASKLLR